MDPSKTTDFILRTSVTWTEFESSLRSSLGTDAKLGADKCVIDIGDGIGYSSLCGLITCDWVGATADERLPIKVVIKIPSFLSLRKLNDSLKMFDYNDADWLTMEKGMFEVHNTEVATYKFYADFGIRSIPRLFYGRPVVAGNPAEGQLCLEYMENSRMMNLYEKHTVEQVRQIARALGKLQACSLKKEPTASELLQDFFGNMGNTWPLETYRGMFKGMRELDNTETTMELMEKVDALLPTYHGSNLASTIHKQMGFRPVLVNGDLHVGNVLIDKDSGDLVALIDWQCAHLGVGVEDLHRIAISALTTEQRRTSSRMLVEVMYNSLVENLDGIEPPYSLDTLLLVSDLLYPHCALYFTSIFISIIKNRGNDPKIPDQEKAERKKVQLDKLIGTLEDVLVLDVKNKKHIGSINFRSE